VAAVLSEADSRLVDAYLRHYATRDDSLLWAFSEVNDITPRHAERGWNITLALISAASNDAELGYVVAGPLEEVLEVHGNLMMDRVEELARTDAKFREALSRVACFEDSMPSKVRDRINKVTGRI
jgi:hypothetical protein